MYSNENKYIVLTDGGKLLYGSLLGNLVVNLSALSGKG